MVGLLKLINSKLEEVKVRRVLIGEDLRFDLNLSVLR